MLLLFLFLTIFFPTAASRSPVAVAVKPNKIYIERGGGDGQHLNFDFILRNSSEEKLIINKIELTVSTASFYTRNIMVRDTGTRWVNGCISVSNCRGNKTSS